MGSNPWGIVVPVAVTVVAASRAVAGAVTAPAAGTAAMATAPAAHVAAPTIATCRFSIMLSKTHRLRRWLYYRQAVIAAGVPFASTESRTGGRGGTGTHAELMWAGLAIRI